MSIETLPATEVATSTHETTSEALYEVVNGERVELEEVGIYAQNIATRLHFKMKSSNLVQIGTVTIETLFILNQDESLRRRPDVAFVSQKRWSLDRELPETGDWKVIPDLCVEVISPHDLHKDVVHKLHEYFEHGVQEVWQVLPEDQQVHIYETPDSLTILRIEDAIKDRKLLPAFELALKELFDRRP